MTLDPEDLRLAVYESFAEIGQPPAVATLAVRLATDPEVVRRGLRELHQQRHVVLGAGDEILMAHPFSAVPLGFAVMGATTLWWGGCAWDSFALPHFVSDHEVLVSTRCLGCGAPHAWIVGEDGPPSGDQVVHFLVPAARMWDDVVHTCRNQRVFCSTPCVDAWLNSTGEEAGYLMSLETLWRLAQHWYDGRLDRGYKRREPSAALDYFRGVGLKGPFWGLQ